MQSCANPIHGIETTLHQWLIEHLSKIKETKALLVNHLCSPAFIHRLNLSWCDPLTHDGSINEYTI